MSIDNYDDIIDSRDVIARIKELEEMRVDEPEDFGDDESDELATLRAFAEDASGAADWEYGETLIRDSYFIEYAQELAEGIGAISSDQSWPNYCIDWERAARDLRMDYTSAEFDGVTYWFRY